MHLTEEQHHEIKSKQEGLRDALLAEDELGLVVRAHIYIEQEIIEYILTKLSPPSVLNALDLDYSARVKLALALQLPAHFKAALTFVGSLRNKFAHRLGTKISKQEADAFEKALGPHNAVAVDVHHRTRKKVHVELKAQPLARESPRDRCVIYFITLWTGLAVAAAKAKETSRS